MKKMTTRILALLLAGMMICPMQSVNTLAATVSDNQIDQNDDTAAELKEGAAGQNKEAMAGIETQDVSIEAVSSLGNLLSAPIEEQIEDMQNNSGYCLASVEVAGKEATVSFATAENSTIIVGIYDESATTLLATGSKDVINTDKSAVVTIDIEVMPQYFYLKAFLVNKDTMKPLCESYASPNYTQEMQAFFAKTTGDFPEERTINLDADESNNFVVFNDDAVILDNSETENILISADETAMIYQFQNPDSEIEGLSEGDIFSYTCNDGTQLIIKVASVSIEGNLAKITGAETSASEVFGFIKIDGSNGLGAEPEVDMSTCDSGL